MGNKVCVGCDEDIVDDYLEFNGQHWHSSCFEVSDSSKYCCGREYDEGQDTCTSCGEAL